MEIPHRAVAIARLHPFVGDTVWSQNAHSCFHLDATDRQLFRHFRLHTLASLGGSEVAFVYENRLFSDSFLVRCTYLVFFKLEKKTRKPVHGKASLLTRDD